MPLDDGSPYPFCKSHPEINTITLSPPFHEEEEEEAL